jgi:hypothetical protein
MSASNAVLHEFVYPFLHRSGYHVMRMQPLSDLHHLHSDLPRLCAHIFERKATRVRDTVFNHPPSENPRICFFSMVAWYLIDDDAGLVPFHRKRLSMNFTIIDVAVWAALLAFRNLHVIRTHMSNEAVSAYTDCFDKLVNVLKLQGCIVHSSYTPID